MSQYVMMPVKCKDPFCSKCPNLELIVDKDILEVNGYLVARTDIICKNFDKCDGKLVKVPAYSSTHEEHALK